MIENELEMVKDITKLFGKKIILFGASGGGRRLKAHLKLVGIDVWAFCDNEKSKWGTEIDNVKVYAPQDIEKMVNIDEFVIIISSCYVNGIIEQLKNTILWDLPIHTGIAIEYGICFSTKYYCKSRETKELIENGYHIWLSEKQKTLDMYNSDSRLIELDTENPILVFHPGKVGSSSIYTSLKRCGLNVAHFCDLFYNIYCTDNEEIKKCIFNHYKKQHNIKIISLVREPISRDISLYFQCAITDVENHIRGRVSNDFIKECRKMLLDYTINRKHGIHSVNDWMDYVAMNGNHGMEFDWFEYEINRLFDIDIYKETFDRQKGYCIIKKGNVELLLMKMEQMNSLDNVIREFTGCDSFELVNDNVGELKDYSYMYREIKQRITFPKEYVDFYYSNNKCVDWFYSEVEKRAYLNKWKMNIE